MWIWESKGWPQFTYQKDKLADLLRQCLLAQGRLLGMMGSVNQDASVSSQLDALLQNIIMSSAIEGEQLNVGSVRSSLAKRLGVKSAYPVSARSEGLANIQWDATQNTQTPLTLERLYQWHEWLFTAKEQLLPHLLLVGQLRGEEPMQVVSGRLDNPYVHYEAPPRDGLEKAVQQFLDWFNQEQAASELDPLIKAGIAHLWFVTLHPFDDGNGRLTRVITDLALAKSEKTSIRFYAMSLSIANQRKAYYDILEQTQKGDLDISAWLLWFLQILLQSINQACEQIARVIAKSRFWQTYHHLALSPEQIKVLNRLLDGGEKGFEQGISAAQYQTVTKVSKATATRHLTDLLEKGCLYRLEGRGRNTRYQVVNI